MVWSILLGGLAPAAGHSRVGTLNDRFPGDERAGRAGLPPPARDGGSVPMRELASVEAVRQLEELDALLGTQHLGQVRHSVEPDA